VVKVNIQTIIDQYKGFGLANDSKKFFCRFFLKQNPIKKKPQTQNSNLKSIPPKTPEISTKIPLYY